jgi:hypothetical protein
MTDTQKLEVLVQKAKELSSFDDTGTYMQDGRLTVYGKDYPYGILFNKDFARALFGDGPSCAYCGEPPKHIHKPDCVEGRNIWPYLYDYHRQQAVVSDNPIDYMYNAVFGDE